jgi:predicted acetyltransferase
MDVEMKKLSPNDGTDIYNLLQEIPNEENGFMNGGNGLCYDEYKQWLIQCDNMANGIGLESDKVPQNIYWLYINGKPVGMGKLRIRLTDKLRIDGGHCGYSIVSSQRGNGYGKLLLNMMVKEAALLGIDKILLTINNNNAVSINVAVNDGGIIEKVTDSKHYVWIECNVISLSDRRK